MYKTDVWVYNICLHVFIYMAGGSTWWLGSLENVAPPCDHIGHYAVGGWAQRPNALENVAPPCDHIENSMVAKFAGDHSGTYSW